MSATRPVALDQVAPERPRTRRSAFGTVDTLPSGRVRARGLGADGKRYSKTFDRIGDAERWLASQRTDIVRQEWRAPKRQRVTVGDLAATYTTRGELRASTAALYRGLWARHLEPTWGQVLVSDVTRAQVRAWLAASPARPTAKAQSYRLLRGVLGVAVDDGLISINPVAVRGAGTPRAKVASRALTAPEVVALADAIGQRHRALVLLLGFSGLRYGEATALQRRDVAVDGSSVRVERAARYFDGTWHVGDPKTEAGRRSVALPRFVAAAVVDQLDLVAADPGALVFPSTHGGYLSASNFGKVFQGAAMRAGLGHVRVHWLRHTGSTLAAASGASVADLQRRLGHSTASAALIYQHAAQSRDSDIARALDGLVAGTL